MNESLWGYVISGFFAVIGSYVANVAMTIRKNREQAIKDAQREQWQQDQFDAINHKLDIHNGYAEKFGDISRSMVAMQKDIEYLKGGKK